MFTANSGLTIQFAAIDAGPRAGTGTWHRDLDLVEAAVEHYTGSLSWEQLQQFMLEVRGRGGLLPWPPPRRATGDECDANPEADADSVRPLVLLFLTSNGLTQSQVWCDYLRAATRPFRAYAHDKLQGAGPADSYCGAGGAPIVRVPVVPTQRGTVSLVRAVIQMLRRAQADGPAARYLVLSGDTVPLTPFDAAYAALAGADSGSLDETVFERFVAGGEGLAAEGLTAVGHRDETEFRRSLLRDDYAPRPSPDQFLKTTQWVALSERAARWFSDPANDHTSAWEHTFSPDEHYWVALSEMFSLPWREGPTVYARWPDDHRGHPDTLAEVGEDMAAALVQQQGYHFVRKVTAGTRLAPLVALEK